MGEKQNQPFQLSFNLHCIVRCDADHYIQETYPLQESWVNLHQCRLVPADPYVTLRGQPRCWQHCAHAPTHNSWPSTYVRES